MAYIGTYRALLKSALGATTTSSPLTLSAANIIVGYDDIPPATQFVDTVGTTAAVLYIRPAKLTGVDAQTRLREWTVTCDLYFGFTRETDNALAAGEGLLEAIFDKWDAGAATPKDIKCEELECDVKQSPVFAHYKIEVMTTGCG